MRFFFAAILVLASVGMIVMFIFLDVVPVPALHETSERQDRSGKLEDPPGVGSSATLNGEDAGAAGAEVDSASIKPDLEVHPMNDMPVVATASSSGTSDKRIPTPTDEILATVRDSSLSAELPAIDEGAVDARERDQEFVGAVTVEVHNLSGEAVGLGVVVAVGARIADVLTADHILEVSEDDEQPVRLAVRWRSTESKLDDSLSSFSSLGRPVYKAVRVLKRDPASDLAVIRVEMPGGTEAVKAASLYPGSVDSLIALVGESAWTTGAESSETAQDSGAIRLSKIQGMEVARVTEFAESNVYLRVDAPSELGMSGGGLFLTSVEGERPRLIGIASGNSMGHGYYVSASVIADLMREIRASGL